MPSFRELLAATKTEIREVTTEEADEARAAAGAVVLDVREPDEYEQGAIPGSVHIARGNLESQIENRVTDRDAPLLVVVRGRGALGLRGQDAARAGLHRCRVGRRRLQQVEGRGSGLEDPAGPHPRPAQPLPAPPAAARGRGRGSAEAARRQGAAAGCRWARLARRAVPGRRRRGHDRHHRHGRRRRVQPAASDPAQHGPHRRAQGRLGQEDAHRHQPGRQRRRLRHPAGRRQRHGPARASTTSSSTGPTTSPVGTCSTTPP